MADKSIPETIPTTEKLAMAMEQAGAPISMINRARAGVYDHFKSKSVVPIIDLIEDLWAAGLDDLAKRAINCEFDGSAEEAKAWADSRYGETALELFNKASAAKHKE
jgi:hypothetical protein